MTDTFEEEVSQLLREEKGKHTLLALDARRVVVQDEAVPLVVIELDDSSLPPRRLLSDRGNLDGLDPSLALRVVKLDLVPLGEERERRDLLVCRPRERRVVDKD